MKKIFLFICLFASITSFGQYRKDQLSSLISREIKAYGAYSSSRTGKVLDSLVLSLESQKRAAGYLPVGNASGIAVDVPLSGDGLLSSAGSFTTTGLRGVTVSSTSPTSNQVLQYNGSQWVPATISVSSTFQGLTDGAGSFTGKTLNFTRVNAGETALEYRTPSQVRSDIGAGTGSGDALTANPLSQFAATTSAQLRVVLTDEDGTGNFLTTNGSAANLTSFPTFNQNTTGSAATLTTPRAIYGNNFDGSASLAQIIASTYGGTGNGFTKFSGPSSSEKIFTLPNSSATILTDNAVVTAAQGGTGISTSSSTGVAQVNAGTWSVSTELANGTTATTQTAGDATTKVATNEFVANATSQLPLGVTMTDDFARASLGSSYTQTGATATWTCNGSLLQIRGTDTGTITEYIVRNDYVTDAEDYTVAIQNAKLNTVNSTSYGIGIKINSTATVSATSIEFWVECDNGANQGRIKTSTNTFLSAVGMTISSNDVLDFVVKRQKNVFHITAFNKTTGKSTYGTYFCNLLYNASSNKLTPNHVQFGIIRTGGSWDVGGTGQPFNVYINTVKNADYCFIGDSQTAGNYGGSVDTRYMGVISKIDRSKKFIFYGNQGATSADIVADLAEINSLASKTYFICIGYNDPGSAVTNITTIKASLEAAGSTVIILAIPLHPSTVTVSSFPSNRFIDINSPITVSAGTSYQSIYNSGDNIHFNALGHQVVANVILDQCRDIFTSNNPYLVQDASLRIYGNSAGANISVGTTDAQDLIFISNNTEGARLSSSGYLKATNHVNAFSTTATAAGTTTLTVASNWFQTFTGSTTQTVVLPVVTTMVAGQGFRIVNNSSGVVTVNTSGANTIKAMAAGSYIDVWVINTAGGTGTASWNWIYTAAINN